MPKASTVLDANDTLIILPENKAVLDVVQKSLQLAPLCITVKSKK